MSMTDKNEDDEFVIQVSEPLDLTVGPEKSLFLVPTAADDDDDELEIDDGPLFLHTSPPSPLPVTPQTPESFEEQSISSSSEEEEETSSEEEEDDDSAVSDIVVGGKYMSPLVASVSLNSEPIQMGQSPIGGERKAPISAYEQNAGTPLNSGLQSFQLGPHPVQAAETLMDLIPKLEGLTLTKLTKPNKIRQVLVIGATGRVGSLILRSLADHNLIIHCLIRANSTEFGRVRLATALEQVTQTQSVIDNIMSKCRVWVGDVSKPRMGLNETDYQKLASRVDAIFAAFAASADLMIEAPRSPAESTDCASLYASAAEVSVTGWLRVFELSSTVCHKHIIAVNSLFLHPDFLQPRHENQKEITITEADVETPSGLNRIGLSPHTNRLGCRAWCAGTIEAILKYAKIDLGYSVLLARLPPFMFCGLTDLVVSDEFNRSPPNGWRLMRSFIQEGVYPELPGYLYALFCQPLDCAIDELISFVFCVKRVHWIYHLINENIQRSFTINALLQSLKRLGLFLKPTTWDDYVARVNQRNDSAIKDLLCDVDPIIRRVLSPDGKPIDLKFSTSHRKHDLMVSFNRTPPVTWPPFREFGKKAVFNLLHGSFFPPNCRGTLFTVEDILKEAVEASGGLTDFGEHSDLMVEGWTHVMSEFEDYEKSNLIFAARVAIIRTAIVYLMNQLYMCQREKQCPEILQQKIKAPTFIVGLNRAGTTFTHQLMSCDKENNRCPVLMEMLFPYGEAGDYRPVGLQDTDKDAWAKDPRRGATEDLVWLQTGGMSYKGFNAMHFRAATSIEEDLVIFEMLGRSFTVCAGFECRRHFEWLLEDDAAAVRKVYPFHKRFFQHLEYQRPGKRWVFKLPWHMLTVETLFETYPDAELIFLHRRPTPALTSWCGLELLMQNHYLIKTDPYYIGRRGLEFMARMTDKTIAYQEEMAVEFVNSHPSLQPPQSFFLNVYFDEIVKSPIVAVQDIYAALQWDPISLATEREMWDLVEKSIKMRAIVKIMTCELSKVGLNKEEVKQRFAKYHTLYFDPIQREKRQQEYKIARAIKQNSLDRDEHFTENGTLAIDESAAWQSALDTTRRSVQTVFSYARSRFTTTTTSTGGD